MARRIQLQFFEKGVVRGFSSVNIYYLEEIVKLCRAHHVQVTLFNTPLHDSYKNQVPQQFVQQYYALVAQKGFNLFEFHHLALTDGCFTADGDHLSTQGTVWATQYFMQHQQNAAFTPVVF